MATRSVMHVPTHALLFMILASLAWPQASSRRRRIFWGIAVIGYSWAIELTQASVYGAPVEWVDICTDDVGVLVALFLAEIMAHCAQTARSLPDSPGQ